MEQLSDSTLPKAGACPERAEGESNGRSEAKRIQKSCGTGSREANVLRRYCSADFWLLTTDFWL